MRVLLLSTCLMVLVTLSSADLLNTLKQVHKSPAFSHLPHDEQILLVELISEAEANQLHAFINTVTMDRVIQLLAHLPEHEASLLLKYLNTEMGQETHHGTGSGHN